VSEVINTDTKILVRYFMLDEDGYVEESKWLMASRKCVNSGPYHYRVFGSGHGDTMMNSAYDWVERYDGDIAKAVSYASRLAKIVKCGKKLLEAGWDWELVMIRDITRRTVTSITDNAMAFLAVAALD